MTRIEQASLEVKKLPLTSISTVNMKTRSVRMITELNAQLVLSGQKDLSDS